MHKKKIQKIVLKLGISTPTHGASLLASGITASFFDRGIVQIASSFGEIFSIYNSQEIQQLIGKHSTKIENILGIVMSKK